MSVAARLLQLDLKVEARKVGQGGLNLSNGHVGGKRSALGYRGLRDFLILGGQ